MAQNRVFLKIKSWHIARFHTWGIDTWMTLCGRRAEGPAVDILPTGKSCESCTRIAVRQDDVPPDFSTMSTEST